MKCPECGNANPTHAEECEYCGHEFGGGTSSAARRTRLEEAAPASGRRRTVFEPGRPKAQPAGRSPTFAEDPFVVPPPARPAYDPDDPFRTAMHPPPAAPDPADAPPPGARAAAPPPAPTARKATIIETGQPAGRRPAAVVLASTGPEDAGVVHVLYAGRNVVGRDDAADITLSDGRVSGQHGFIFLRPDGASFIDVSTNGSMVNGRAVIGQEVSLEHGAVMQLGGTVLVFTRLAQAPRDAWAP